MVSSCSDEARQGLLGGVSGGRGEVGGFGTTTSVGAIFFVITQSLMTKVCNAMDMVKNEIRTGFENTRFSHKSSMDSPSF